MTAGVGVLVALACLDAAAAAAAIAAAGIDSTGVLSVGELVHMVYAMHSELCSWSLPCLTYTPSSTCTAGGSDVGVELLMSATGVSA